jgi:hypothetical protein
LPFLFCLNYIFNNCLEKFITRMIGAFEEVCKM